MAGLPATADLVLVKVDVIGARPLSRAIADETGVKHESPQVLWLAPDGRVTWHASHRAITGEGLALLTPPPRT